MTTELTKHAGGRPAIYNASQIAQQVDDYLLTTGREQTKLATKEGFALYVGTSVDTLDRLGKENEELCGALKKIEIMQKEQLMNDSFYGGKEVNAGAGIFLLKANHKMSDGNNVIGAELKDGDKTVRFIVTRSNEDA